MFYSCIDCFAEVQAPVVCLLECVLTLQDVFVEVPHVTDVYLFNQGLLPTHFQWGQVTLSFLSSLASLVYIFFPFSFFSFFFCSFLSLFTFIMALKSNLDSGSLGHLHGCNTSISVN